MKNRVIDTSRTFLSVYSRSFTCHPKLLSMLVFIAVKMCGCVRNKPLSTLVSFSAIHLIMSLAPDASSKKEFRITNQVISFISCYINNTTGMYLLEIKTEAIPRLQCLFLRIMLQLLRQQIRFALSKLDYFEQRLNQVEAV